MYHTYVRAVLLLTGFVVLPCRGDGLPERVGGDAKYPCYASDTVEECAILRAIQRGDLEELKELEGKLGDEVVLNIGPRIINSADPDIIDWLRNESRMIVSDVQMAAIRGDAKLVSTLYRAQREKHRASLSAPQLPVHDQDLPVGIGLLSDTPLRLAIRRGHVEVARALIEDGANVDERLFPASTYPYHSVLSEAIHRGRLEIAQLLVDAGAEVHEKNRSGTPLLSSAIGTGRLKAVEMLLEAGADPNVRGDKEQTPLHHAARKGHVGITRLLIEKGADVNAQDVEGRTPLWFAAVNNNGDVADLLRESGAK